MNRISLLATYLTCAVQAWACNGSSDDESVMCAPNFLINPSYVSLAKRSPDKKGWCCQPSYPSCDCRSMGGFVRERCHCGEMSRPGVEVPANICDLAPPDWVLGKDAHGCMAYTERAPTTACCNCPNKPDGGAL